MLIVNAERQQETAMISSLAGKFFIHTEEDSINFGEVVYELQQDSFMIRDDASSKQTPAPVQPMYVMPFGALDEDWLFFDTREEMEAFRDWLLEPGPARPVLQIADWRR
jgi:hypothetical protein